jgi:CRISPR-associated protein Csd2
MKPAQTDIVNRRYDFVLLFDVVDGNPNGDPDAGNLPRIDPQSMQGLVTDGCLKRKIRNAVAILGEGKEGNELYFQTQDAVYERRILNLQHQRAYDAEGIANGDKEKKPKDKDPKAEADKSSRARRWMCKTFYDIRAFGAVMTTGVNCGQVRGPVQLTFARSIDPVVPLEFAITRKSVTKEEDARAQVQKDGSITGTMGRKNTVPYALYRSYGFVNPHLAGGANGTGLTFADLELLWQALKGTMWEIDRSASRGLMTTRGLYVFEHASVLGSAPTQDLFDRIEVTPLGADAAPRDFASYKDRIRIRDDGLANGVTLHRMVG